MAGLTARLSGGAISRNAGTAVPTSAPAGATSAAPHRGAGQGPERAPRRVAQGGARTSQLRGRAATPRAAPITPPSPAPTAPSEHLGRSSGHESQDESYDVYVYEAEPLEAGVAKHTLSVLVADESGLINRVAGVFARRGANIESLAVGLTSASALFTIVVTGTEATVSNLCKQLAKLVSVSAVEDITGSPRVERELLLCQVAAADGPSRAALRSVAEAFRARVVDVAGLSTTVAATGDPGKMAALQRALSRFGILELVRTGRISLKRGGELFTDASKGGWKGLDGRASGGVRGANAGALRHTQREILEEGRFAGEEVEETAGTGLNEQLQGLDLGAADCVAAGAAVEEAEAGGATAAAAPPSASAPSAPQGDAYSSSGRGASGAMGVWNVRNVLEAHRQEGGGLAASSYEPFTVLIEVLDRPGVLNQVTGVVSRRGYNVQSLAVGNSEREGFSRITMMIPGDEGGVAQLVKHLSKLAYVDRITNLNSLPAVVRELMLVKVTARPDQRTELLSLASIFHGTVCDVSLSTVTLEVTGREEKMSAIIGLLEPYGILEIARTGRIAMARASGVDSKFLSGVAGSKVML